MARFIFQCLKSDEAVLNIHRPNWQSQLPFLLLGVATINYGVGAILLFVGLANYGFIEIAFTDRRILATKASPFSKIVDIPIEDVVYLSFKQSYLGRKFNYGTIIITRMNGSKTCFKYIARPQEFCDAVNKRINPN